VPTPLNRNERRAFRKDIAPAIRAAVAQSLHAADPWELEALATALAGPEALGSLEDAYALEAVAMAEEERGGRTLLAALAAVALPPMAGAAAAGAARLAGTDAAITPAGLAVGSLRAERAWVLPGERDAPALLHVALSHDAAAGVQVVSFDLDAEEGGAIADGITSAPMPEGDVEGLLSAVVPGAPPPVPIEVDAAGALLLDALRANLAAGHGPTADALEGLPLAVRAAAPGEDGETLMARVAELPLLEYLDDEDPELDEEAEEGVAEALAEGFADACAAEGLDPAGVELATRIAREMMFSRAEADAGPLEWDAAAVRAFLLDHAAARMELDADEADPAVELTAQMLVYLGVAGLLERARAGALAEEALSLREAFRSALAARAG
jgi:hypothetical protein